MALSHNRYVAIYCAILAVMPIGILTITLPDMGPTQLWTTRSWNPMAPITLELAIFGIVEMTLAVLCFANRSRTRTFWGGIAVTFVLLAGAWLFFFSWQLAFFRLVGAAFAWHIYRVKYQQAA